MSDFVIANVTSGKLNALVKNLMKATGINDPSEAVRAINAGEWNLSPVAKAVEKFLEPIGEMMVEIYQPIDSDEFFTARSGLFVEDSFKKLFVGGNAWFAGVITVAKHKISKNAYDREIVAELPENYVFEAGEFCQVAANLITEQWGGKVGVLLSNGYANIFYVRSKDKKKVFVVSVDWHSDFSRWRVYVWPFGGNLWGAECVTFSCN